MLSKGLIDIIQVQAGGDRLIQFMEENQMRSPLLGFGVRRAFLSARAAALANPSRSSRSRTSKVPSYLLMTSTTPITVSSKIKGTANSERVVCPVIVSIWL